MNLGPKKYQNLQKLHQKSYEYFWNSVQTQILRNHSPKSMIWCKNCKEIQCFRVRGSSELFSSIFSNFLAFAFFLTVYEIWQPFFEMKISKRTPRPRSDTKIRVLVLIFHAGKIAKVRRYFCTIIGYNGLNKVSEFARTVLQLFAIVQQLLCKQIQNIKNIKILVRWLASLGIQDLLSWAKFWAESKKITSFWKQDQ